VDIDKKALHHITERGESPSEGRGLYPPLTKEKEERRVNGTRTAGTGLLFASPEKKRRKEGSSLHGTFYIRKGWEFHPRHWEN